MNQIRKFISTSTPIFAFTIRTSDSHQNFSPFLRFSRNNPPRISRIPIKPVTLENSWRMVVFRNIGKWLSTAIDTIPRRDQRESIGTRTRGERVEGGEAAGLSRPSLNLSPNDRVGNSWKGCISRCWNNPPWNFIVDYSDEFIATRCC